MKLFWCMCHKPKPHLIFSSDKLPEIGKGNSGEIDLELFFYNLDFELRITYFDIMINYHLSQKSELMKRVILVFSRLTNIQKCLQVWHITNVVHIYMLNIKIKGKILSPNRFEGKFLKPTTKWPSHDFFN